MTQIDSRDRLAAVIRRQVASLAKPAGGAQAARPSTSAAPEAQRREPSGGSADVAALVSRRIRAIDRDDPSRYRKAFRVFLESVLLAELGENLINDASFHQLVDEVHTEMSSDRELADAVHSAAEMMLRASEAAPAIVKPKGQ